MSTHAEAASPATRAAAPARVAQTHSYYWSLRRELWENRSIWIAPLAAAGFVLFGYVISLARHARIVQKISKMPPDAQAAIHLIPYGIAVAAILIASLIVAVFYCLGTLYNERRDRSILFWKSMPVSDATTVLAKASVPLVILPLVAIVTVCVTQLIMLLLSELTASPAIVPLLRFWMLAAYGVVVLALWYAPIYAWLMVLSAWAKRAPFLWAVLPPLALIVVEKLAFDTDWIANFVKYRLNAPFALAFTSLPEHHRFHWPEPDPASFFSAPALWLGLLVAAALFALATWLRRRREPM